VPQRASLTFRSAAVTVLRASARPLTTREITNSAIAKGLLHSRGRTPAATMAAQLYRSAQGSSDEVFVRIFDPGLNRAKRGSVRWTLKT
jgi:hypothetical protein